MSILTGNALAIFFMTFGRFYPLQKGASVVSFSMGLLMWLLSLSVERERKLTEIALSVNQRRDRKYRIGKIIE